MKEARRLHGWRTSPSSVRNIAGDCDKSSVRGMSDDCSSHLIGIFMSEKLSKCPHEFVNVFRITFVFPMQDQLSLYKSSGMGIYWFGKPSL